MTATQSDNPTESSPVSDPVLETEKVTSARALRRWLIPTLTGAGGFLLGAALVAELTTGGDGSDSPVTAETRFQDALTGCNVPSSPSAKLGDDGRTITIDSHGEEDMVGVGLSYETFSCLLTELKAPASVIAHVGQTTSLDGRQIESWDGITFAWSYHPDRGADGVYTLD